MFLHNFMLKLSCWWIRMKKFLITFLLLFAFNLPGFSEVVHVTLDEAVDIALKDNLDLQSKRRRADELKQEIKIANALKNPQFQSNFLIGKVTRGNSSQFGAALPVEIAKRGVRKKIAQINLKIAEDEIRAAEHNLKIEIMRNYFNILYMKSVVSIMQERERLFRSMKSVSAQKSKASSENIDVLQNNMKYEKQLVFLNQARGNLLGAQFALNDAMNIKNPKVMYDTVEASLFAPDLRLLDINLLPYQTIEDTAMQYSYSLSIARENINRAQEKVTQAKRMRIPDLTLGGGYAYQTAHQTGGDALPGAYVGAAFEIPILYTYSPEIKMAKITLERADIDKDSYENHLKFALKEDYNKFKYAKDNIAHYKIILSDSGKILDKYKKRYEKGQATWLNLIQVENAHQETLREYINAVQMYYESYLNLMQNVGHEILIESNI